MAKRTHIEYLNFDGIPVDVRAIPVKWTERLDYRAFTDLGLGCVATIWRDPHQPRTHEWIVTWTGETQSGRKWGYFPTLYAAMFAIGQRAVKEARS